MEKVCLPVRLDRGIQIHLEQGLPLSPSEDASWALKMPFHRAWLSPELPVAQLLLSTQVTSSAGLPMGYSYGHDHPTNGGDDQGLVGVGVETWRAKVAGNTPVI